MTQINSLEEANNIKRGLETHAVAGFSSVGAGPIGFQLGAQTFSQIISFEKDGRGDSVGIPDYLSERFTKLAM